MANLKLFFELALELESKLYFSTYQIGEDNTNLFQMKQGKLISDLGSEYLVFKYLDDVIKIHRTHADGKNDVDVEMLKSLRNICTKRFIMPNELIYESKFKKCVGYSSEFIDDKKSILYESMDHILDEFCELLIETSYLTDKLILISDLHENNFIYNDKIHIIDIGKFVDCNNNVPIKVLKKIKLNREDSYYSLTINHKKEILEQLKKINNQELNDFFIAFLVSGYPISMRSQMTYYFNFLMKEANVENVIDYINETKKSDMLVIDYLKEKSKTLFRKV